MVKLRLQLYSRRIIVSCRVLLCSTRYIGLLHKLNMLLPLWIYCRVYREVDRVRHCNTLIHLLDIELWSRRRVQYTYTAKEIHLNYITKHVCYVYIVLIVDYLLCLCFAVSFYFTNYCVVYSNSGI